MIVYRCQFVPLSTTTPQVLRKLSTELEYGDPSVTHQLSKSNTIILLIIVMISAELSLSQIFASFGDEITHCIN